MHIENRVSLLHLAILSIALLFVGARASDAHCDALDGPVVAAGRAALASGDLNPALVWVREEHEPEIRRAFAQTVAVRGLSPEAQDLADRYFFETLVRLHRAGEGAPYTGLAPAGRDLGPAIPAADRAIELGSVEAVEGLVTKTAKQSLRRVFQEVVERKDFDPRDVSAGREYVEAYVGFIHHVERLYQAAAHGAGHHGTAPETHEP